LFDETQQLTAVLDKANILQIKEKQSVPIQTKLFLNLPQYQKSHYGSYGKNKMVG
jgi:hypothetical protein